MEWGAMTDKATIIEAMETAFDVLGAPSPADVIHARKTLRAAIALAAVLPAPPSSEGECQCGWCGAGREASKRIADKAAPPSIPEREKVLEAISRAHYQFDQHTPCMSRGHAEAILSAIAALEGK